jgi:hypothetical protein
MEARARVQFERLGKDFEDNYHLERAYDYVARNVSGMPDERAWRSAIFETRTVRDALPPQITLSAKDLGVSPLHHLFTEIQSRGSFDVKGVGFVVKAVGEKKFHEAYEEWLTTGRESLGWEVFRKACPDVPPARDPSVENP